MSHYEFFLLILGLVFCVYASYTDLKTRRIRNLCSFGLLYVGTLSQLMAWYQGTASPLYIVSLFLASGVIAFAFYWLGIFSPGDAKFFWGLCLIFPISIFSHLSGALSFTPLILVLNIIVPYCIGMLGYLIFKFLFMRNKLRLLSDFFKATFQNISLFEKFFSLLVFIGVESALRYLLNNIQWEPDAFLRLVLVFSVFTIIQRLLAPVPKVPVYYVIMSFVSVWVAVQSAPSVSVFLSGFAYFLGLYLLVFVIAKRLILSFASITLDRSVNVDLLQVGMIPAEQIVEVTDAKGRVHYEKKFVEFSNDQSDNILISPNPVGLSDEEISKLQRLAKRGAFNEFENKIKIQPSIRFAPVISMGALMTVLCQGPFYLKITQFF